MADNIKITFLRLYNCFPFISEYRCSGDSEQLESWPIFFLFPIFRGGGGGKVEEGGERANIYKVLRGLQSAL